MKVPKLQNLAYSSFVLSPMVSEIFKSLNTVRCILWLQVNLMEDKEMFYLHLLHVVEIHPFMLINLGRCVYHVRKPASSFPMLYGQ
jgi:hypothetical protein